MEKSKRACLVKARDFPTFPNLHILCLDEGFEDFNMRYVGGLWVMIEFNSKYACKNFMDSEIIEHWLLEKCGWDHNFFPLEHIVGVDVEGLPLCSWSEESFRKIVARWGSISQLEDDLGEDVYKNRVCILSSFQQIIYDRVKVRMDEVTFTVRVKEAPVGHLLLFLILNLFLLYARSL